MEEEKRDGRSCLKIFRCIGDLPENDGSGPVQDRDLSRRKCKWRFGKRTECRRVLSSNALLTEPSPPPPPPPPVTVVREKEKKEEVEEDNSEAPPPPAKISVVKFAEHTSIIPPRPSTDDDDCQIEDSIVILIQTSIRKFLAQKEMAKLKSIVKLQAAVRGHLVRRQAVGTLRCVQAIVKLQALVRSRQHRSQAKGGEKDVIISDTKQTIIPSDTKEDIMHSSTEKLLANGFARQLLELSPSGRAKVIHISFEPTRSDSAWKWLERWMTVTSLDVVGPQQEPHLTTTGVQIPPVSVSYLSDEKQEATECRDDDNSAFPIEDHITLNDESEAPSKSPITEFHDPSRQISVADSEHSRHATERMDKSVEEESDESRRFGVVLRKSFNPAFAAVQLKFQELSAVPKTDMSSSGDNKTPNFADEQPPPQSDVDVFKKLEMNLMAETAASRCGTEISVSSTLDSPDNLTEAEVVEAVVEPVAETVVEAEDGDILFEIGALDASDDHRNVDSETTTQEQKNEEIDIANSGNRIFTTSDHTVPTDEQPKHGQETDQEGNGSPPPPEGSSHMLGTTHERQTCDSNIEKKGKKTNARIPAKKPRFQLSGSNSPVNQNTEATPENLTKTGKRNNLLGTRKLDDSGDFEPTRISSSSSSNSLPSYMQATESARAKAHAGNSPKSASPEVQQNKETCTTKKRHSLPFIDGKHASSPRMQHQSSKAANAKSPQTPAAERKWRR